MYGTPWRDTFVRARSELRPADQVIRRLSHLILGITNFSRLRDINTMCTVVAMTMEESDKRAHLHNRSGSEFERLPRFPEFKPVELSDRSAVDGFTSQFEPYSDFNFTSLWAWDTKNDRRISALNGNLVVKLTDYQTGEPFLSYLGQDQSEKTAKELIQYSVKEGLKPVLRWVPEVSISGINSSALSITEDRDHFDYIYSVDELSSLSSGKFKSMRQKVNRFVRQRPDVRVEAVDLGNEPTQQEIISVLRQWESNKVDEGKSYYIEREEIATRRLFETADSHRLTLTGLRSDARMLGYAIAETLPNRQAIGHFWKADKNCKGAYEYLMHNEAIHLRTLGMTQINYEQDLGIKSLRDAKESMRPRSFLKKYTVSSGESA